MEIPKRPDNLSELDLMKQLKAYADGEATWKDGRLSQYERQECEALYTRLTELVNKVFALIMDRATAREMQYFTMHDRYHGLKVAHLMWHILKPEVREKLTPPEIGMMIGAAFLHDAGMSLTEEEREKRLNKDSELWERLELDEGVKAAFDAMRAEVAKNQEDNDAVRRVVQAEEALLCLDTRERHATHERYEEVLAVLRGFHREDPTRVPDVDAGFTFDGLPFLDKLIEVCESHRGDPERLTRRVVGDPDRWVLSQEYPVGCANANLHLVASALRIADTLDFDRERTPPVLFHYLLPGSLGRLHKSVLEWAKHLAISNWTIENEVIVFRGRCADHVIHQTVIDYCGTIEDEIAGVRATFDKGLWANWPFKLPKAVQADIHAVGYQYLPFHFELDDDRIYKMLMGRAIYDTPLAAVRELVQNAVDACKLRDAWDEAFSDVKAVPEARIYIRYDETDKARPKLIVQDKGTGMDREILQKYFLKVGRSFYNSTEFSETRLELRKKDKDFAPVSEFGVGFMAGFMVADRVEVSTARWQARAGGDMLQRRLVIDGPTRIMRVEEMVNDKTPGTTITLFLTHGIKVERYERPPTWLEIKRYLRNVCVDLPYPLNLEYWRDDGQVEKETMGQLPLPMDDWPLEPNPEILHIPVDDHESGLRGEIVLISRRALVAHQRKVKKINEAEMEKRANIIDVIKDNDAQIDYVSSDPSDSVLTRGGFRIKGVTGLPKEAVVRGIRFTGRVLAKARLSLDWDNRQDRRFLRPNLARTALVSGHNLEKDIGRIWLSYLLQHADELPNSLKQYCDTPDRFDEFDWLEDFSALQLYEFGKWEWIRQLGNNGRLLVDEWEQGKGNGLSFPETRYRDPVGISLLARVLPYITRVKAEHVKWHGIDTRFYPPQADWKLILANCHTYLKGYRKCLFVDYLGFEENILMRFDIARFSRAIVGFNSRFEKTLRKAFDEQEMLQLAGVLSRLDNAKYGRYSASITLEEVNLVRRVQAVVGIGKIGGSDWHMWQLVDLDLESGAFLNDNSPKRKARRKK